MPARATTLMVYRTDWFWYGALVSANAAIDIALSPASAAKADAGGNNRSSERASHLVMSYRRSTLSRSSIMNWFLRNEPGSLCTRFNHSSALTSSRVRWLVPLGE